jgi:uridine kinase
VDELAARLVELRAQLGRAVGVGISGVDCAGKSTLAESLQRRLESLGEAVLVISGDEFTRPTRERYADEDEGLSYYRDSFDYRFLFEELLPAIRAGFTGELHTDVSDWPHDGWRGATFAIGSEVIVIVEGCFLFTAERADAFDLRIWIDLPIERVVERALLRPRDLERMGGADGVRARYAARYLPGQRLHLANDGPQELADIVLSAEMVQG